MTFDVNKNDKIMSIISNELIEIEGDVDVSLNIPNNSSILIFSSDQSYLTHGIHKFPAKFFPELPRYLIRKYSQLGALVLDPMCGSGTTILEALLNNRIGIGIDIDPIAQLITKVKTTPLDMSVLNIAKSAVLQQITDSAKSLKYGAKIPDFYYRDKWFRSYVLQELATISNSIDRATYTFLGKQHDDLYDFLRIVFSSIIRDVSNADPHCTRTVLRKKVVKKIGPGDTLERFRVQLESQTVAMAQFAEVYCGLEVKDVRLPKGTALETGLPDSSIDLAITSPPYINAVDYTRTHQLEMYWLGLLDDSPLSHTKRKYIGTETVYKDEYQKLRLSGIETLDPTLEKIYARDPKRSYITYKFFEDMKLQLDETFRVLKPGSRYCLAIGNNLIRGVYVRSHEILSEIATSRVGFELEKQFFSKLIRHFIRIPRRERMHGEWVLIFRKPT